MARRHIPDREDIKQFVEVFDKLAYAKTASTVFSDFTTMMACTISNGVDGVHFERREDLYKETSGRYGSEDLDLFAQLAATTVCSLHDNPNQDYLGDVYTGLNLLDAHKQQFFTPYNVSLMMAKMLCGSPEEEISREGYIAVSDPTCGSGCMLVAYANALREMNVDVRRDIYFVAQDIDPIVARMCYIQLAILNCSAVVRTGNSLIPGAARSENTWLTPGMFQGVWVDRGLMVYADEDTNNSVKETANE